MKKILLAAFIVGAVVATLILIVEERQEGLDDETGDVQDAASSAYRTMNRHIHNVEKLTEGEFDGV